MNKTLEEIAVITYGKDYKNNPPGGNIPIYGTGGIMGYTSKALNNGPSVLTGRKGSINNPIYLEGDFWNVDTIYCIKTLPNADTKWFYYNLCNKNLSLLNEATGVPSVSTSALNRLTFNYLELPHQRKTARILTTVDKIIEKTEAAIAKYKAIKQGMMHDLFTRGVISEKRKVNSEKGQEEKTIWKLRPKYEDAPELYKKSELGMIPKEWEVARIEKICSMKSGEGITSKSIIDFGIYPVYGGNGLRGYTTSYTHDGEFVLIGRQGALCGNVYRVSKMFYASEHAVVVSVYNNINVDWIYQVLKSMNLNQYSEASAQPGLAVSKIEKLLIKCPFYNEQNEISDKLLKLDSLIESEYRVLHKKQQLKQGLMQDLLTGKKEVTPDPEDFFSEQRIINSE